MIKLDVCLLIFAVIHLFACSKTGNSGKVDDEIPGNVVDEEPVNTIASEADATKYLISEGMAGPFRIGSELPGPVTMMKYRVRVEQVTRVTEEGPTTESVTIIAENSEDLLWLKPGLLAGADHDNTITEIIVLSPKYRTQENIGVGSTIFDFLKTYPDYHVWYTYVSDMYVIESDTINAQFILDKSDYTGPEIEIESEITPLLTSDFKKTGKIKRIRLFRISNP